MKISFVILTWNRYKFLDKCLSELLPAIGTTHQSEVIVMDNGSTDLTSEVLEKYRTNPIVKIITRTKNYGLNAYKKLFAATKGEYIVIVDDDVLNFPENLSKLFIDYLNEFPDYGFIALNVVQNELTNGAKPTEEHYTPETRNGKHIEFGPTGGWCACFKKSNFNKIKLRFLFTNLNMAKSEDGLIASLFSKKLKLKSGIIKDHYCLHACGPHYAKEYGHLDREIEKYKTSGLHNMAEKYKNY